MDPSPNPVDVPFTGSIRQDFSRAAVPAGNLWVVGNGRRRGLGAWGKAYAYSNAALSYAGTAPAAGTPHFLTEFQGRQYVGANYRVYSRTNAAEPFFDCGRVAKFRPIRSDFIGQTSIDHSSLPVFVCPGVAALTAADGRRLVAVSYRLTNGCRLVIRDVTNGSPGAVVFAYDAEHTSATQPRILAADGYFIFTYIESSTGTSRVRGVAFDTANTFNAATAPVTLISPAGFYDAIVASDGGTNYLYTATGTAVNQITINKRSISGTLPSVANQATITSFTGAAHPTIAAALGGITLVYWGSGGATAIRGRVEALSLGATLQADTAIATAPGDVTSSQLGLTTADGQTTAWLTAGCSGSGIGLNGRVSVYNLGTNLSVNGSRFDAMSLWPASKPENGASASLGLWCHTDDFSVNDDIDRRLAYYTFDIPSPVLGVGATVTTRNVELVGDSRVFHNSLHLAETATVGSGDSEAKFFAAQAAMRSGYQGLAGVELHAYEATNASPRTASVRPARVGNMVYIPGGTVTEAYGDAWLSQSSTTSLTLGDLRLGVENNFIRPPVISGVALAAGGSLVDGGTYQYAVVWEWLDTAGNRHRSSPSNIAVGLPAGANRQVVLTVQGISGSDRVSTVAGALTAVVYRTANGGADFRRLATVAAATIVDVSTWTYTDGGAVDPSTNEIIYVQSQTSFPNKPAPACRFAWVWDGRLCLGGLWEANAFEVSRQVVPGQPAEFTRAAQFRQRIPEPLTAGAELDGQCILFSADGIWAVFGSGPSNDGRPALPLPQRLPSDIGCIDPRSLIEVPAGLMFQSRRGIALLPRGLGPPKLVGAAIQHSLGTDTIRGAGIQIIQDGLLSERVVGFATAGTVLVADLDTLEWISVDGMPYFSGGETAQFGTWGNKFVGSTDPLGSSAIIQTNTSSFTNSFSIQTGELPLANGTGRFQLLSTYLRGELRDTDLTGSLSITPGLITYGNGQFNGSPPTIQTASALTGTFGDRVLIQYDARVKRLNSVAYTFNIGGTSEAFYVHGLGLQVAPLPGPFELPVARRVA